MWSTGILSASTFFFFSASIGAQRGRNSPSKSLFSRISYSLDHYGTEKKKNLFADVIDIRQFFVAVEKKIIKTTTVLACL